MSRNTAALITAVATLITAVTAFFALYINWPPKNHLPEIKTFKENKPSPQPVQTVIKFTADAKDDEDTIRYRFWLKGPSANNTITFLQDWSTRNWCEWTPTEPGDYEIGVYIRDGRNAANKDNVPNDSRSIPYTIEPQQIQPAFMGGLKLQEGLDSKGIWRGFVEEHTYVMENRQDSQAINYYYFEDKNHENPRDMVVKVQVESDQDTTAGAGLIYALDPQKKTYYIYSLGTNGEIYFYKINVKSQELKTLCSEKPDIDIQKFNELRIIERDQKIEIYFNGKTFNTCANKKTGEGFSGIVAYGTGRFQFKDFNYKVNK